MTMKTYIPLMILTLLCAYAPLASAMEVMAGTGKFIPLNKPAKAVFVANSEIVDVSAEFANMLYVYGLKQGSTTLHVLDAEGKIAYTETITVSMNTAVVMDAIKQVLPSANIKAEFVGGRLVLKGMVKNASDAEVALRIAQGFAGSESSGSAGSAGSDSGIINMMTTTADNQVMLRVRVAEVNRDISQSFGVQWNLYGNDGNTFRTGLFSPRGPLTTPAEGNDTFRPEFDSYKVGGASNPYQSFLSYFGDNLGVDVLLEALEDEGMATVLAEPNLTALSGESASFLAGGEFPVITSANDGQINTEYKEFGVRLSFTPVVLSENRIRLNVKPEVSNLSDNGAVTIQDGIVIPALESRKVETTVELGDGQGFLLAGLFQNNLRESLQAVPGLGDLPILGPLFRSENFERKKSELMIIVTPSIVTPVSNPEVAFKTPQSDLRVPTFAQRAFGGQRLSDTLRPSRISGSAGSSVPMGGAVME